MTIRDGDRIELTLTGDQLLTIPLDENSRFGAEADWRLGCAYSRKNSSGCASMYGPTKTSGLCFGLSSSA